MASCADQCATVYTQQTGRSIGVDLTGVSYAIPRYMMLDFLIAPVFDQAGVPVEFAAVYDAQRNRTGTRFVLQQGESLVTANIIDWRIVLIEPNIGVGLWDRVALREEHHELERARSLGIAPDWDRVGENARIVLRDLNRAGEDYLDACLNNDGLLP